MYDRYIGPGERLTESIAEDVPVEAFVLDQDALSCTECTMRFDRKTKLEMAVAHARSHLHPSISTEESPMGEFPTGDSTDALSPSAPPVPPPVRQHRKREGRIIFVAGDTKNVVFNFKVIPRQYKELQSKGVKIRSFLKERWTEAEKHKRFPQSNPGEELMPVAMSMRREMAETILDHEKGDWNFDWWVTSVIGDALR